MNIVPGSISCASITDSTTTPLEPSFGNHIGPSIAIVLLGLIAGIVLAWIGHFLCLWTRFCRQVGTICLKVKEVVTRWYLLGQERSQQSAS